MKSSRIKKFYTLDPEEKIEILKNFAKLNDYELQLLRIFPDELKHFDMLIENRVGVFPMPLGIAPNIRINGIDYFVPMVTEESSVVAGLSKAATYFREDEGIVAHCSPPIMIGQIFITGVDDIFNTINTIYKNESKIMEIANTGHKLLRQAGGGAVGVEVRELDCEYAENTVIVHLLVNVADAMGANVVNTMCERVSNYLHHITKADPVLKIVSNYAEKRIVRVWAKTRIGVDNIEPDTAKKIVMISKFARADIYRAVTHNKGILNGIDAVLTATGQDTRANEAGIHAYASRNGRYSALSEWKIEGEYLTGFMEIPLQVGIIGGVANIHPSAKVCLKILKAESASDLARVVGACGLCQNFAALHALVTTGIQKGHMKLHARKEGKN